MLGILIRDKPNQARIGAAAVFFLNGFGYGTWVPRIAEIQAKLALSLDG